MPTPVLFIHGMFMTGRSWAPWQERFEKKGFVTSAPSWPGRDGLPSALRATPDPRLSTLTLPQVVEQYEKEARRLGNPVLIGHSMGGLVVQQLLSRGAGALGIAIDSAPPLGVRSFAFSHLKANAPVLWPGSSPIEPTVDSWRYAFWHTGSDAEVRSAFDREVVPESRLVGKGPLGDDGKVDFARPRPPLLMIAGELDHIIPASLNAANAARYDAKAAPTELMELKGRTHFICGQPGWEEVADACLAWIQKHATQ